MRRAPRKKHCSRTGATSFPNPVTVRASAPNTNDPRHITLATEHTPANTSTSPVTSSFPTSSPAPTLHSSSPLYPAPSPPIRPFTVPQPRCPPYPTHRKPSTPTTNTPYITIPLPLFITAHTLHPITAPTTNPVTDPSGSPSTTPKPITVHTLLHPPAPQRHLHFPSPRAPPSHTHPPTHPQYRIAPPRLAGCRLPDSRRCHGAPPSFLAQSLRRVL